MTKAEKVGERKRARERGRNGTRDSEESEKIAGAKVRSLLSISHIFVIDLAFSHQA